MEDLDISKIHLADLNDTELLRSRINQQSDLICILKKRADEYLVKYTKREDEFVELNKKHEQLSNLYKEEQRRGSALENTYFTLGKTHQELLKTHSCTVSELETARSEISDLQKSNVELLNDCERKNSDMKHFRESVGVKESATEAEVKALKLREAELLEQLDADHVSFEASLSKTENRLQAEVQTLKKQAEITNNLLTEANRKVNVLLNEEEARVEEFAKLTALYTAEKKRCVELEEKSRRRVDKSTAEENELLHRTIEEMEQKHNDAISKFEVYKKYAEEALGKEKSLNSKLRKLKSAEKFSRSDSAPSIGKVSMT